MDSRRRHGRSSKLRTSRQRSVDGRLSAELSEWSAIVGHDVNTS
jgi:hypothetical protein